MRRRSLLLASLFAAPCAAPAQSRAPAGVPLRFGADVALVDSGLAAALQRAFGRATGILVEVVRAPALPLLDTLAAGELDVGLVNAPEAESGLDKQGLVYDRRSIAQGDFVLVGPAGSARMAEPAGINGGRGVAAALLLLHQRASAAAGAVAFISANDGSGSHVAEQAAWRLAAVAPQPPWYRTAPAGASLIAAARALGAYALVERGVWNAQGGAPLAVVVEGDSQLVEQVHAMRSFRSPHPAGKLFIAWIAGGRGRALVAGHRGYRVPTA